MILMQTYIEHNKQLSPVEIAGEICILNIETGKYYFFNESASSIWRLISEPSQVSTIISHLMAEYNVSKEECQISVFAVLEEMLTNKLIETVGIT